MSAQTLILVRVRGKGFSVISPPGDPRPLAQTLEAALGIQGGYSAAEVEFSGAARATSVWVAWVEGTRGDHPYVDYRFYPEALTESRVRAQLAERGEEVLDLQLCEVLRPFT